MLLDNEPELSPGRIYLLWWLVILGFSFVLCLISCEGLLFALGDGHSLAEGLTEYSLEGRKPKSGPIDPA